MDQPGQVSLFLPLIEALDAGADRLRESAPFDIRQIETAVADARRAWRGMLDDAGSVIAEGLSPDVVDPHRLASLQTNMRERATSSALLADLGRAEHVAEPASPVLESLRLAVQEAAVRLGSATEMEGVMAPFRDLHDLIACGDRLSDAEAKDLSQRVERELGADLAFAASRGRLRLATHPSRDFPPVEHDAPHPAAGQGVESEQPPTLPTTYPEPPHRPEPAEPAVAACVQSTVPPGHMIHELANALRPAEASAVDPPSRMGDIPAFAHASWRALAVRRPSLAFHIARAMQADGSCPPELAAMIALAPACDGSGRIDDEVNRRCSALWPRVRDLPLRDPVQIIGFVTGLRVALLAMATDAPSEFQRAPDIFKGSNTLNQLMVAVAEIVRRGQPITPSVLASVAERETWELAVSRLGERAREWLAPQQAVKLSYQRATEVWHRWIEPGETVGRLIRMVIDDRRREQNAAREEAEDLEKEFNRRLTELDRKLHGARADRKPIEARAKHAMQERVRQVCGLVREWVALLVQQPGEGSPARGIIANLHSLVHDHADQARREIDEILAACDENVLAVARNQLEAFFSLFNNETFGPGGADAVELLNADLLLAPSVSIGPDFGLPENASLDLADLVKAIDRDWIEACRARIASGDFPGARLCLRPERDCKPEQKARAQEELEAALNEARQGLEGQRARITSDLAGAASSGQISEEEHADLAARLEALDLRADENVARMQADLGVIEQQLRQNFENARKYVLRRLDGENVALADPDARARIRKLVQTGQIEVANDYLERLQNGETLPATEVRPPTWSSVFPTYFGAFVEDAERLARDPGLQGMIARIEKSPRLPAGFEELSDDNIRRQEACALLRAWTDVKARDRQPQSPNALQKLLEALGLNPKSVQPQPPQGAREARAPRCAFR
jgi:cell division septum initiation protein DivIVA